MDSPSNPHQEPLAEWEPALVDGVIRDAEQRLEKEKAAAGRRALQLAREKAYHRLAVAIDRPKAPAHDPRQLSLFSSDLTLFDDAS